jgi:exonuclease SbcD
MQTLCTQTQMTTTILHVSDTHLGNRQYGSDERREDYADAFEHAIQIAIEEEVDAVLHTGDLFDSKNPSLGTQIRCAQLINRLEEDIDSPIPFLTIVGNHERKRDHQFVDYIELSSEHLVRLENKDNKPHIVNDEVAVYGFDHIRQYLWETSDLTLQPTDGDYYNIVAMHQLLHPPVPELLAEHSTRDMFERFGIDTDALALGDYHQRKQQQVEDTFVYYPGSTEKTQKDDGPNHYVDILQVEDGRLINHSRREIPTRDFLFIKVDLIEGIGGIEQVKDELDSYEVAEKVVKVTLEGADVPITRPRVHKLLQERDVTVSRVSDGRSDFEFDADAVDYDIQDIETTLDDELNELDLTHTAREVEEVVRTLSVPKSNIRAQADDIVQKAAPGAVEAPESEGGETNSETDGEGGEA